VGAFFFDDNLDMGGSFHHVLSDVFGSLDSMILRILNIVGQCKDIDQLTVE
jgi:Co/Zn/Cd efflux system component